MARSPTRVRHPLIRGARCSAIGCAGPQNERGLLPRVDGAHGPPWQGHGPHDSDAPCVAGGRLSSLHCCRRGRRRRPLSLPEWSWVEVVPCAPARAPARRLSPPRRGPSARAGQARPGAALIVVRPSRGGMLRGQSDELANCRVKVTLAARPGAERHVERLEAGRLLEAGHDREQRRQRVAGDPPHLERRWHCCWPEWLPQKNVEFDFEICAFPTPSSVRRVALILLVGAPFHRALAHISAARLRNAGSRLAPPSPPATWRGSRRPGSSEP